MKIEGMEKLVKKGDRVAILGFGISNVPLVHILSEYEVDIVVRDKRTEKQLSKIMSEFSDLNIKYILGDSYLDDINEDVIFKTPGIRYDLPQLVKARENGSVITSEMEMFFELCPADIIGITGSDGKTTTTTLIYELLNQQGYKTWLGGNIGKPLFSQLNSIKAGDKVVVELSSFQLHTMNISPKTSVITNITPNHLDVHKDYAEYINAKKNVMLYQDENSRLVLNYDNDITKDIGKEAKGKVIYFSRKEANESGIYTKEGYIYFKGKPILKISDIKVPGLHNVENYMAAIGAVGDMVDVDTIKQVARSFTGVEHRIEFVREIEGVKYYNSSIDSSPNRTKNTLEVFEKPVILIAGGKDKGIPYDEMGSVILKKVKKLILIGATANKIETALKNEMNENSESIDIEIARVDTYDDVVKTAYNMAKAGDIVVLSPASTSFDMFANFEERGNLFKQLVNAL